MRREGEGDDDGEKKEEEDSKGDDEKEKEYEDDDIESCMDIERLIGRVVEEHTSKHLHQYTNIYTYQIYSPHPQN